VRYFGGTKLGTGGLVRAYGAAANEAIAQALLVPFESKTKLVFKTEYSLVQRVEHYFAKQGLESGERQFEADGVRWEVMMTQKEEGAFKEFASLYEREGLSFDCCL
jgi:putative IMPACT (imprinted ancient) family translation regulator